METGKTSTIRVASYNIRKARGLDQRRDPHRIVEVINGLGADVVALQEADLRLGDRPAAVSRQLLENETDFRLVPVAENDVSVGWHGNAVLLHKSLQPTSVERIELPGMEPRGAVRVDIDANLTLVATHLGLMRRHRRAQLAAITSSTKDVSRTVIAGDFNEWSADRGLEPLAGKYAVTSPGRSFHAARPVAALDRIANTRDLEVKDAGVDESRLAKRASDHLPVWVEMAVRSNGFGSTDRAPRLS